MARANEIDGVPLLRFYDAPEEEYKVDIGFKSSKSLYEGVLSAKPFILSSSLKHEKVKSLPPAPPPPQGPYVQKSKLLHPYYESDRQLSPNLDKMIDLTIEEQNDDIAIKEYLGQVEYLLGKKSKFAIFSEMYPEYSTKCSIRVTVNMALPDLYWLVNFDSGNIKKLASFQTQPEGAAISLTFESHANMLWLNDKHVQRYEPDSPFDNAKTSRIDDVLNGFFTMHGYTYGRCNLPAEGLVQSLRNIGRKYPSDYFCQDYSLLYALNRIEGMSHEEAAFNLVGKGEHILEDLKLLLRDLTVFYRKI
jgi:hypothetical protein